MRRLDYNKQNILILLAKRIVKEGGKVRKIDLSNRYYIDPLRHISFVLNDVYYYYQFDRNPLFAHAYIKTKVLGDETYSNDACSDLIKSPHWGEENKHYNENLKEKELKDDVNILYNSLMTLEYSIIRPEIVKVKVNNTYNNGTHIEEISKERFTKVDENFNNKILLESGELISISKYKIPENKE